MVISDTALAMFLLPPPVLAALVTLFCALSTAAVWVVCFRLIRPAPRFTAQAAFHVAITGLFALMLSFTASDAWRRSDAAYAALLREAAEIAVLADLLPPGTGPDDPRAPLRDYLSASLSGEWARQNTGESAEAAAALGRLRTASLSGLGGPDATRSRLLLDRTEALAAARTARLVAGGLFGDALRWAVLATLFVAGVAAIAIVHLDRPAAATVALALYALAAAVAASVVAVSEHPYAGWDGITPDRLAALLARLS